jgi:hypothetical protein
MDIETSIETIASALAARDGRGGGRATAMIGAGFSRNAQPTSESNRKFPLWRDIVRPLIDELLPPCSQCPRSDRCPAQRPPGCVMWDRRCGLFDNAAGASGMMSLGDKFQAQKGSARLRAALEKAVPDDDYAPGLAHQLLVRLPWADIFTTNWDSLLERAVDTYDRSYDSVVTVEQIASTCSPRIVKLHGCARSGSRLIFTEEDFRTYPKTFAPFVSLVQQSLMENVVVLFGFSGADPNFRAWHGWVRDHLGSNIQPIYLVTLRPTDPIDVNLMAGRLINQIDLSQKQDWEHLSSSEVIEKFLAEIHSRLRNLRVNLDWPTSRRKPSDDDPSSKPATSHLDWRMRLDAYPRWLVAPARNRSDLLLALDEALSLTFDQKITTRGVFAKLSEASDNSASTKGALLTEREQTALIVAESLRIALARPGDDLYNHLQRILVEALINRLPPNQSVMTLPIAILGERITGLIGDLSKAADEAVRAGIIIKQSESALSGKRSPVREVVLGLLPLIEIVEREARLRNDLVTAQTLRDVLWMAGGGGAVRELAVRGALATALTHLQIREIDALLSLWPEQPHDAASNLRRSAILREIGWIEQAYTEVSRTVGRLRSLGSARRRAVGEASREAWAFYLYADLLEANKKTLAPIVTPHQRHLALEDVIGELHERLDELETNRCDPRREIERLSRDLDAATTQTRLRGTTDVLPHFRPPLQHIVANPASTFVILSEMVGVAANHSHGTTRLALGAARLLAANHRQLAIGLLLRAGTPEDLQFGGAGTATSGRRRNDDIIRLTDDDNWPVADAVFDRARHLSDCKALAGILDKLVTPSHPSSEDLVDLPYLDRKVRLLQHLIAGLIEREGSSAAPELIQRGFALACRVACSPVAAANCVGWSNQLRLFEVVLPSVPVEGLDIHSVLTELLDLPIPSDADTSLVAAWPDPFRLWVEAWLPKKPRTAAPVTEAGIVSPAAELRPLGKKMVGNARDRLSNDPQLRSTFEEMRRGLPSVRSDDNSERRFIVARRRKLLDAILSDEA